MIRRLAAVSAAVALAAGLASCSSPPSLGARVTQWVSANQFGQSVGTLLADNQRIVTVVRQGQGAGALRASCGVLESDASTADGSLPTPDTQLTAALNQAFHDEAAAANRCYGASPAEHAVLQATVRVLTRADALLESAVQQVSGITGTVPPTTTTTVPGGGGGGDPFGFGG